MEKSDLLLKDIQDLKSEVSANFPVLPLQHPTVSKEARFALQYTPATTWSNCIEKTQNMLRGSGTGQETAGWFHFHKVATSGHEIYTPPMDMQQVYYQTGVPEVRNSCYAAPDPRSSYTQMPPPTGYPDLRPPSQVVNQRFIQCVNHFAPGSRSLPCLLQPSYYGGCRYDIGGPVQTGSDTMLARMEPCEISRPQRYAHHEWTGHQRTTQEQPCYRQPWDYEQGCQTFIPRYQESQGRKGKNSNYDAQDQKNKEKGSSASFSYLATEVSREMQGVITAGGHALADLLDFCKFVQSFLFSPSTPTTQRNQLIREIILSFIHVSSAYVHLGSVLLLAEQSGLIQSELDSLRTPFSLWETTATSVVMALRTLIHSLSETKVPEHKNKMPDPEEQSSYKPDPSFYANVDSPFFNYGFGDNSFRFSNPSRNPHRSDFGINQQYEFKRKYQQNPNNNAQKDNNSPTFTSTNMNSQKNSSLNFKTKSCNQLNVQHSMPSSCNSKTSKACEQRCASPDSTDFKKSEFSDNQDIKHFCFNLLNPEKKKCKGKFANDHDRSDKHLSSKNRKNEIDRPGSNSSSWESKDEAKEQVEDVLRNGFKQMCMDPDVPKISTQQAAENNVNRFSYLPQPPKVEDWSFGVLNTGDKRPFPFLSTKQAKVVEPKPQSLLTDATPTPSTSTVDAPEKPMSSDGEGSPAGRFSNPELNKALEEHCEAARIQLKHKMLDILGFLQTSDTHDTSSEQMTELKKSLQESLNKISYMVYSDRYRGVGEMLNAVRSLFHKTRVQHLANVKAVRLADELEANFLDLFKKEFGCCGILYPQSRDP